MKALSERIIERFSGDRKMLEILLNLADSYQESRFDFTDPAYPTPPALYATVAVGSEDTYGQRLKSVQVVPEADPSGWTVMVYVIPAATGTPVAASAVTPVSTRGVTTVVSTYEEPIMVDDLVLMVASFVDTTSGDLVGFARTKFEPPRPV